MTLGHVDGEVVMTTTDALYLRGHVPAEVALGAAGLPAERLGDPYYAWGRWSFEGKRMVLREYHAAGRGHFALTVVPIHAALPLLDDAPPKTIRDADPPGCLPLLALWLVCFMVLVLAAARG